MRPETIVELETELSYARGRHPKMESMHQAIGAIFEELMEVILCRLSQKGQLLDGRTVSRTGIRDEFRAIACIAIRAMDEIPWALGDRGKFPD